ncbi:hypothetical protein M7I_2588 [Glarea lozoyensis 74030]|nr:hypothetical protein M7I_2588 [Glarea lozoyensis 74030]
MEDPALALLISKLRAKARTADQIAEENNILVNQLEKQSTAARESIAELNTRLKEAEQKGNAEDVPRDTTGLEYVQVHADLARKKERISQLKEDLRVFRDKLLIREASLERNKERLKLAQEALQKRNSDVDSTSAERALQQKVDEAEQGRKKYIDEIEYRKERYRQVEIRLSTEEVARKNADDKAARLLNELSVSKDSIAAAEQKNATVSKLLSSCREKLKRAENGKRSAEEQASRLSDKLSQSEEEELRLTSVKTAAEAKIIELRNELSAAEKRVSKGPTPQTKKKITALEELVKDTDLTIAELTGALYASLSHLPRKNFKVQIETLRNHTLCRYESSRNKSEDAVVRHERFNKSIKIAEDISAYLTLIGENGDIEGEDWSISAGNKRKRVD